MSYKTIANLIPTIQAAQLANENVKTIKKKKTSTKDILGLGMKNIIGTSLIKAEADLIAGL